jgi:putative ABC transport system ATP-binding protein
VRHSPATEQEKGIMNHTASRHPAASSLMNLARVSFAYADGAPLFEGLDLSFNAGDRIRVHGASGSGKTTLLRIMAGLELPQAGTVRFDGTDIQRIAPPVFRSCVVYMQQIPVVVEASVRQNLLLPFSFAVHRERKPPDDRKMEQSLEHIFPEGIRLDQAAPEMSVGQLQRLCFARALLLEPRALLLDEPVSALDSESAGLVMAAALAANRTLGTALVLNTHTAEDGGFAPHRSLEIRDGRLQERGDL